MEKQRWFLLWNVTKNGSCLLEWINQKLEAKNLKSFEAYNKSSKKKFQIDGNASRQRELLDLWRMMQVSRGKVLPRVCKHKIQKKVRWEGVKERGLPYSLVSGGGGGGGGVESQNGQKKRTFQEHLAKRVNANDMVQKASLLQWLSPHHLPPQSPLSIWSFWTYPDASSF